MMYSPKISEQLIPVIYRRAKHEHRPMTKVVNDILLNNLLIRKYCQTCNGPVMSEEESDKGYCEYCESEVFLKATIS